MPSRGLALGLWEPDVGSHLNPSPIFASGAMDRVELLPCGLFFMIQAMGAHL